MGFRIACAALAVATLAAAPASAAIVTYTSRSAFDAAAAAVSFDWGEFGPAGSMISTPDMRAGTEVVVGVGSSQGELARHDEGTGFTGDFAPGDHLLTDAGSQSDSLIVRFGAPVRGFGTQIESDALSGAWTGSIDLYDSSDTLIETVAIGGVRGSAENNSAPFFGVLSDTAEISYALFWVNNPDVWPYKSGSLAMNRLDVVTAAPEPSALLLAGGGILILGSFARRRQGLVK